MGMFRNSDRRAGDYLRELGAKVQFAPYRRRVERDSAFRREQAALEAELIRRSHRYHGETVSEAERIEGARKQAAAVRQWAEWEDHYGGEKYKIRGDYDSKNYQPPERLVEFRAEYRRRELLQTYVDLGVGLFWAILVGVCASGVYVLFTGIDAEVRVAFFAFRFVASVWALFVFVDFLYRRENVRHADPVASEAQVHRFRQKARKENKGGFQRFAKEELFRALTFGAAVGGVYVIGHWPVGYWRPVWLFTAAGFFGYLLFVFCVFIWKTLSKK